MKSFFILCVLSLSLLAQDWTKDVLLPQTSQAATTTQRIGITDLTVTYNRPSVKGREIWDKLVPYGKMWRTGANANTTISFTHPVSFGGKEVAAATYGVHTIPNEDKWTFILSSNHTSWGSYFYRASEDVLKIDVFTKEAHHQEQFAIGFDALTNGSATLFLHWEKKRVEIPVTVNTHEIVYQNFQNQLRNTAGFSWQGWKEAAEYLANNKIKSEKALEWIEQSLKREKNHSNLLVKVRILRNMKKPSEAKSTFKEAISIAPEKLKPRLEKRFKELF